MFLKLKETLSLQECMDNLAAIAEIDMEHPSRLGIIQGRKLVTDEEELPLGGSVQWLSEEGAEPIFEILDKTYRGIHQHLLFLYEDPESDWDNKKMETGMAAVMTLVGESANKMDRYLAYRLGVPDLVKIAEREEFKALQRFYLHHFQKKIQGGIAGSQVGDEGWERGQEAVLPVGDGLKDFETVRQDKEYELFYIRNEEGKPYFNTALLRNIKLKVDLASQAETFEEDPLLKVRAMQDRDLQASANQILGAYHAEIEEFFKIVKSAEGNTLARELRQGIMALFLAANPHNLLQNTNGKSCLQYFNDFHAFLRNCLKTGEYQKWIAYPPDRSDKMAHVLLSLVHGLCRSLFMRVGGVRQESVGLIHRTMRRGEEGSQGLAKGQESETVWNQFLREDEKLRSLLLQFPNGPLFKILDVIREEQDENTAIPFDPIGQGNLPSRIYQISYQGRQVDILRLAAPIIQSVINKADVVDEFRGFLRSRTSGSAKKHLIVNLQDRTSWREFSRVRALESLQKNAEFGHQIFVMTLPKDTDFYYQNNEYLNPSKAEDFLSALKLQVQGGERTGYGFPPLWKQGDIMHCVDLILPLIHTQFFHSKETLSRRNREDFIEIFYQFLILQAILHLMPDSISFTCKDAVDTGAAESAAFYGFLKLLRSDSLKTKEERDFLLWLLYTPALFMRERAIDPERLNRALAMLERCDAELSTHRDAIMRKLAEDRGFDALKTLDAIHL
ncbi:MAG: hypothetical protein HY861_02515 [Chlamydiia bacterium]|nr:hypothetical protein [Chlamydiia bacterium]